MKLPRRQFLHLTTGAVALPAVPRIARAQAYPSRPVRFIVTVAAGGSPDIIARLIGQWLSERLGQPVIVENRPGAAGNIGTEIGVRAPPDGYTLLLALSLNAINVAIYDKLPFNFIRDTAPVASIASTPFIMEVNPSVPAKTVPEFIAYAKANPGKINMASDGKGAPNHVAGELFKMMAGVDMIHVPYRGGGLALTRSDQRPSATLFRRDARVAGLHQGRHAACAGSDRRYASGGSAGCSDHGRISAWLRGERMVWGHRTQTHTRRNCRETQPRNQRRSRRSQHEKAPHRARSRGVRGVAGRIRQVHRRRN